MRDKGLPALASCEARQRRDGRLFRKTLSANARVRAKPASKRRLLSLRTVRIGFERWAATMPRARWACRTISALVDERVLPNAPLRFKVTVTPTKGDERGA
jgi:hypothetical protein